jgi:hypothetical protein
MVSTSTTTELGSDQRSPVELEFGWEQELPEEKELIEVQVVVDGSAKL